MKAYDYYLVRNRKDVAFDISDDQFDAYLDFINFWQQKIEGYTRTRFSGGEPLVLGDRLFELADRVYKKTGSKPFMLTAGKELCPEWTKKAKKSALAHIFVSIENPLRPDPGAPDPIKVVKAIKENNSKKLPIVPGVCLIPNDLFFRMYDICKWIYEQLGEIPLIAEINFDAYKSPTEEQWKDLEINIEKVLKDFFHKTPLNLFSSVSPELAYGVHDPYIFSLDLENSYGITKENYTEKLYYCSHFGY